MKPTPTEVVHAPGVIDPTCTYTLQEFMARAGWSAGAWRAAKRRGLRAVKIGPRYFVRGADFCRLVDQLMDVDHQS